LITRDRLILTPRALYGAAAALVLVGIALRLAPASLPPADPARGAPVVTKPLAARSTAANVSLYAPIAGGNVFTRTRKAPLVRFVPEGRKAPDSAAAPVKPRQPVFRLYGITVGAGGAVALIDADPKVRGAELYRVGDRVGGFPITGITDSTVVIARKGGSLILRLRSAPRAGS
jgi:hypothetical protein